MPGNNQMKDVREKLVYKLCSATGVISLILTQANFFFLKKARIFTSYRPIVEHYGNEILHYYLIVTIIAGIALYTIRKDSRRQALLTWGIIFTCFSNEFTQSKWPEVITIGTGLILLTFGRKSNPPFRKM